MVNKCHAPPMCKTCRKYHHTLLHIKADPKTEDTKKVSKEVTPIQISKPRGEVLLMTFQIKVIAPDSTVCSVCSVCYYAYLV